MFTLTAAAGTLTFFFVSSCAARHEVGEELFLVLLEVDWG